MYQDLSGLPACGYVRISADREGRRLGTTRQRQDGRRLGDVLHVETLHIFCDDDKSAAPDSKDYRADFVEMVAALKSGKYRVVWAYSTSRLTRDTAEAEILIELGWKLDVHFVFVASPAWDLQTADGRQRARDDANRDRGEVERLQERVLRKKLADAESGAYPGGRRCFAIGQLVGVNPANGKEVRDWTKLDQTEAKVLREMHDRILEGVSQFALVKDFNTRGLRTSLGTLWTVGKLKRTLLNPSYVQFDPADPEQRGTRQHKGARHRAVWPAVFTQVEHDLMVNYFKHNPNSWQQGQVIARRYLLSGFTHCGRCGGVMYGQGKTDTKGRYIRRYHCKKYNNRGEVVGCGGTYRLADPVEYLVTEAVLARFDSPRVAEALAPADNKERVAELTQQLVRLQARRRELAVEHALTPLEDYGVMLATIKSAAETVQNELNRLRSEKAKAAMVPAIGSIREKWETASLEWKASVIKLVVSKIVIMPTKSNHPKWPDANGWVFNPEDVKVEWSC